MSADEMIDAIRWAGEELAYAIKGELDGGEGSSNMVQSIEKLAGETRKIAHAITPLDEAPGRDAGGGMVSSLTEAIMGMSDGMHAIASSIENLSDAIRDKDLL